MAGKNSLLEDLYTDSGGFDAERAASVLKQLLTIQRGNHSIFFKKGTTLKEEDKVLAYMLVKKLLKSEGVVESSETSGKEIKKQTPVKSGTVDAAIKRLKDDRLIAGSGSNYEIPAHEVETIMDRLEKCTPKKG